MRSLLRLCFILLSLSAAVAATPDFLLGVDYSELIPNQSGVLTPGYPLPTAVQTDANGSIYLLIGGLNKDDQTLAQFSVVKLSPAGDQIVYSIGLDFQAVALTVDPAGNVYLAGQNFVQKRNPDGKTVAYTTTIAADAFIYAIAVDAAGRAYMCGSLNSGDLPVTPGALQPSPASPHGSNAFVVRLTSNGAVDYATYLGGASPATATAIAVDSTGSAFVTGTASPDGFPTTSGAYLTSASVSTGNAFLLRLAPDGSSLLYSTFLETQGSFACCIALTHGDEAEVAVFEGRNSRYLRINANGTSAEFSTLLPSSTPLALVADGAGHTYAALLAPSNIPVRNNLATCVSGSSALAVLDDSGNISQVTYIAGAANLPLAIGLGSESTLYAVGLPGPGFQQTRVIPDSSHGIWYLDRYSPNPNPPLVPLACVANSASYDNSGITGGEIVSLYGEGLGPATGTQPHIDPQSGVPKELAGVQVTFNGTPAPLLYVQDAQINAIAPWALQGKTVDVCVLFNDVATNCIQRPVLDYHPGVFMEDDTYAIAYNQDGSLNSAANPAEPGSWVYIFATGLGPVTPQPVDGSIIELPLPKDVLPTFVLWNMPTGFIGSIPTQALSNYAGPAPFRVAGVSQINMIVEDTYTCALGCGTNPYFVYGTQSFLVHLSVKH